MIEYAKNILELLRKEFTLFPLAQLQDIYKLFYQDYFGPQHYITDLHSAENYLNAERENDSRTSYISTCQPIFCLNSFYRIDISLIPKKISRENLLNAFIQSSLLPKNQPLPWNEHWKNILNIIENFQPLLLTAPGVPDSLQKLAQLENPVHHSEIYRQHYQPHYRLLEKSLWLKNAK